MDKKEKKRIISAVIDLANGRYKDKEVDTLYDLVKNRDDYNGTSRTYKRSFDGWSSDGKYTREEETTYTVRSDEEGVRIEQHYEYRDDDGQTGSRDQIFDTGREILNALGKIFLSRDND